MLSTAMINTTAKSNLGRRGFISHYTLWSVIEGIQGRNSRKEPVGRDKNKGHGGVLLTNLLLMACTASILIAPTDGILTVVWVLYHQSLIKKRHHKLTHRSV